MKPTEQELAGLDKQELMLNPSEEGFTQFALSFNRLYEALTVKYGTIPEEVDRFVIEKVGMRLFGLLQPWLSFTCAPNCSNEQIDNPFIYIPYMGVGSEENMVHITEEEHKEAIKRVELFMDTEPEEYAAVLQYGKDYLNLWLKEWGII